MLLEIPYKAGDIVSLKLSTGEELVSRLDTEDAKTYTVKKPMVLIANEKGLGLAPFMYSVSPDGKFVLNASTVTCIGKTEGEIAKQYTATTSGIQMV
tara:strand:- start:1257 stop:1547 length:291 start_codon:yes stop_codon:yes gene_type:complete